MTLAERLVARVDFPGKSTGPERGPSWARASGVAGGGWKGLPYPPEARAVAS